MQLIADLQLHSKYSRATSPNQDIVGISKWASQKGINLIATGDWTHPLWFNEITANLKEVRDGIYTIKNKPKGQNHTVYFILSTEISSIYTHKGKGRRVHNLILSPSIATSKKIIDELKNRGANLLSDGRPIVGLSSKEILELALEIDKRILFIPAHVWTPWFSLYGSKSGYDSIEECFEDLSPYIYAVETGLSSDPRMNWQIKELDNRSIISCSDAHSGPKLGREATVFIPNNSKVTKDSFTFDDITGAIKQDKNAKLKIGYTIEFFPEEGKYHWSGHRKCNIKYNPQEVQKKGKICPVCHSPLTIGVENRVLDLAGRTITEDDVLYKANKNGVVFVGDKDKKRKPYISLIPLLEILTETTKSPTKAQSCYQELTCSSITEFDILMYLSEEKLKQIVTQEIYKAVKRVRSRDVYIDPGYDNTYGIISLYKKNEEKDNHTKQKPLF